jgi:hypothetical protein
MNPKVLIGRLVVGTLAILAIVFGFMAPASALPIPIGTPIVPIAADANVCASVANDTNNDNVPVKVACAVAWVHEFAVSEFGPAASLPSYVYIPLGSIGLSELGIAPDGSPSFCGYISAQVDLDYCNGTVHLGQGTLDNIPSGSTFSLAVIAAITAHETTHHWETVNGPVNLDPIFMDSRIFPYEQTSDCGAGAAIAFWISRGYLPPSASTDAQAAFGDIAVEGDDSHGSRDDRESAFELGFSSGLHACNALMPADKTVIR